MPFIEIEEANGTWNRQEVTHEERRRLLLNSYPEQHFIDQEGVVFIAHPSNMWTVVSDTPLPSWRDDERP